MADSGNSGAGGLDLRNPVIYKCNRLKFLGRVG
jgi:hypothetical protein